MKKTLIFAATLCALCAGISACSDWTEAEAEKLVKDDGHTDAYYAELRRWKAETKHDVAFGWFGFWSGTGTSLNNSMIGIPDSVHMISVWGPWLPSTLSDRKREDMAYVRKVKGTKVLATCITGWVGTGLTDDMNDYEQKERLWGWEQAWNTAETWCSKDPEIRARQDAAIRKYARAIADSVMLAGYDGFDIDYEPVNGGSGCKKELGNKDNFHILVDELGKYFGPMSGTDKMLVLDGNVYYINGETAPYFDYFIEQAYSSYTDGSLDTRFKRLVSAAEAYASIEELAAKYIVTSNFESYAPSGGGTFTRRDGTKTNQLQGFAEYKPTIDDVQYSKAGFGAYHIEMEYTVSGKEGYYPWTRAALRTVHPPKID